MLQEIKISEFKNNAGSVQDIHLSYEIFGKPLGTAPVVLINHALTGNSSVIGKTGWWKEIVGDGKSIDTQEYTILAFNTFRETDMMVRKIICLIIIKNLRFGTLPRSIR